MMSSRLNYLVWLCCCCCCYSVTQATDNLVVDVGSRISNGDDAFDGEIPYAVSLQNVANSQHFCGGSILSSTWIITAAHCTMTDVITLRAEQIQVVTGTINSAPRSVHRVTRIRRHERYSRNDSVINDIALLKVTPPFVFDRFVAPVRLPDSCLYIPPGTKAVVAGWGTTTFPNFTFPVELQKLDVTIISEKSCKEIYMMKLMNIYSVHVCTYESTGQRRASCKGDSGGPLTINRNILVGIVSWSHKNGNCGTYPNVYTRVSKFTDWIMQNTYE